MAIRVREGRPLVLVALSLVVVAAAGVAIWYAYEQGLRRGIALSPPLIQADTRPTKIPPGDPGGEQVLHQDKLVFDALDPAAAPEREEHLLPLPEEPLARPIAEPPSLAQPEVLSAPALDESAVADESPDADESIVPAPEPEADGDAPDAVGASASSLTEVADVTAAPDALTAPVFADETAAAGDVEVALADLVEQPGPAAVPDEPTPAVAAPPEPAGEPSPASEVATAAAAPAEAVVLEAAPPELAPVPKPREAAPPRALARAATELGEYRVQLGAYRDELQAAQNWQRVFAQHRTLLGGLQPYLLSVDLGRDKGVYHRVQAGPLPDAASARALCATLKQRGQDCLVVAP